MKILIGNNHLTLNDIPMQIIDEIIKDDYIKNNSYIVVPVDLSTYVITANKEALYDFVFISTVMLTGITIE